MTTSANQGEPASFFARLVGAYTSYTVGVLLFILFVGGLEWAGVPNNLLGYLFLFSTIVLYAGIGFLAKTSDVTEYYVAGRVVRPRISILHATVLAPVRCDPRRDSRRRR